MMSSFLDDVKELFEETDFYSILNVAKTANNNEIRKAYYKLSLKVHPDRVAKNELEQATKKFQVLGKIYEVLSNEEQRTLYDETGTVGDECSTSHDDRNWYEYWRLLFARVTTEDIEKFEETYKGSDEELKDLKKAYLDAKGDMDQIIDNMMCATVEDDEARFRNIITDWIKNKVVKSFKAFTSDSQEKQENRKRKASAEALEAERELKKLAKNGESSLAALIQRNQKSRANQADDFFAVLEQKYGGKSRDSSKSSSRKGHSSQRASSAQLPHEKGVEKSAQKPQSSTKTKKSPNSSSSSMTEKDAKESMQNSPNKPKKVAGKSSSSSTGKGTQKSPKKSPKTPKKKTSKAST